MNSFLLFLSVLTCEINNTLQFISIQKNNRMLADPTNNRRNSQRWKLAWCDWTSQSMENPDFCHHRWVYAKLVEISLESDEERARRALGKVYGRHRHPKGQISFETSANWSFWNSYWLPFQFDLVARSCCMCSQTYRWNEVCQRQSDRAGWERSTKRQETKLYCIMEISNYYQRQIHLRFVEFPCHSCSSAVTTSVLSVSNRRLNRSVPTLWTPPRHQRKSPSSRHFDPPTSAW